MADIIGRISVPIPASSGLTFPLKTEYPAGYEIDYPVIEHRFQSAATLTVQRFSIGPQARRFFFSKRALKITERASLVTFWEAVQGSFNSFIYNAPNPDGTTTAYNVVFETQPLSITDFANQCSMGTVFIEIPNPSSAPVYTVADRKSTRLNSSHLGISYA